jgi:hypothetical protein
MRICAGMVLIVALAASGAWASNVDWNVNVNVGSGGGKSAPAPAPYPGPPPVVVVPAGPVFVSEPPLFLAPARLGFWVAVGVPYDMVFIDGYYYLFHGNYWYASPRYNGPWTVIVHEHLPPGLRKHHHAKIRDHRDKEYMRYEKKGPSYRGQSYKPEKGKGDHPGRGKGQGHRK